MTKQLIEQLTEMGIMPVYVAPTVQYKTHTNANDFPKDYEVNTLPSLTIPDQSLTVEELVYRFSQGQTLGGGKTPIYEEDLDIKLPSNWDKLDISEKYDFYKERAQEYQTLQEQLKIKQNEILEVQKQKTIDEAVNAKFEALRQQKENSRPTIPVKPKTQLGAEPEL